MIAQQSLLLSDARIVAEDDAYIVVSVRIPKSVLHKNIRLLSSAIDASLDRRPRSWRLSLGHATALLVTPAAMIINWLLTLLNFAT